VGDEFQYYPSPDASYTATLTYYARIPALSVSATTNWLLTAHPDAYLYGALLQAAPYLRDNDALQVYGAGYTAALSSIRAAERTQAGKLRVDTGLIQRRSYDIYRDI